MNDESHWQRLMGDRVKPVPRLDRLRVFWRLQAPSGRVWECALYRVETGLELRVQAEGKDDPVMTHLFRSDGPEAMSESWRATLIAKGFTEVATP